MNCFLNKPENHTGWLLLPYGIALINEIALSFFGEANINGCCAQWSHIHVLQRLTAWCCGLLYH